MRNYFLGSILLLFATSFNSCNSGDDGNTISVDPKEVAFGVDGGTSTILIKTNAAKWSINNPISDWLDISKTEGTGSADRITLKVVTRSLETRTGTLIVTAGNASPFEVKVSQSASEFLFGVSSDLSSLSFTDAGGDKALKITTDATNWNIAVENEGWIHFSKTTGEKGLTTITITADVNPNTTDRTATIKLSAPEAANVEIPVTQSKALYPNYNTSPKDPDATGMGDNAVDLATKMKLGWNIGNALEATGGETAWGSPKVTKEFIDQVKQNGFNAIRIPCSWNQYLENTSTAQIKTTWLDRVKEVVGYCVDNDMYVVLNIHWDGGWLENNCTPEKQAENNAKQKAFWQQIATHLRDVDSHLLFASANEPNVEDATQMAVLKSYHQTFINAVRSTGGKNSYRTLVIQGPSTDIEKTNNLMTTLPTDAIEKRLMVEVHYYTPYQFCLMTEDADWGKMFYYWGAAYHNDADATRNASWGEESTVDTNFKSMKTKFVDKGIPVVMGEYGAMRRLDLSSPEAVEKHLAARAFYLEYVTKKAIANGMIPFYWDAGGSGNHGMSLFDRSTNQVVDQQALTALLNGLQ